MNCKPGDMAIQILSEFPENIGSIVEVIDASEYGVWNCKCTDEGTCENLETGELYTCQPGDMCLVDDYKLIPIKGMNIKTKELENTL